MFEKHYPLSVVHEHNNKSYNCYVVETDTEEDKVKIHYVGFGQDHEEWIKCDSNRIIKPEDGLSDETKIALGGLMRLGGNITEKVISVYDPRKTLIKNEKAISALTHGALKACAECLSIKTMDDENKRLTRSDLAMQIITKIKISLPKTCLECQGKYKSNIGVEPLFTCYLCNDVSHDCDKLKNFKTSLLATTMKSFVWLCEKCHESPTPPETVTDPPTENLEEQPSTTSPPTTQTPNPGSTDPRNTNDRRTNDESLNPKPPKSPETCKRLLKGTCPHGLRGKKLINGNECRYTHPKPCKNYCSYGLGKFGCRRKNCEFAHPTICKYSENDWKCTNKSCTYTHLKGTRRSDIEYIEEYNTPSKYNAPLKYNAPYKYNTPHKYNTPREGVFKNQETRPKNDQLERIEQMIRNHNEELKKMSTELHQVKGQIQYVGTQNHPIQAFPPPSQMMFPSYASQVQSNTAQGAPPSSMSRSYY